MTAASGEARRFEVDGEVFLVRDRNDDPGHPGHTDLDWETGPNPGYGFTMGPVAQFWPEDAEPPPPYVRTDEDIVRAIRDFLSGIDPETGYLRE